MVLCEGYSVSLQALCLALQYTKARLLHWLVKCFIGSLAKITLHSIRIEAAMLLFKANATNLVVMGRLQYLLTVFRMYYRNTPTLARIHARAMESSNNYTPPSLPIEVTDDEEDR